MHYVFLYSILAVLVYVALFTTKSRYTPLAGDGLGYYAYLPSIAIYHDPGLRRVYDINHSHSDWQQNVVPSKIPGRYFDKYPMGVALMMLPFFLLGDLLTVIFGLPRDGYSFYYAFTAGISGVFYCALGIFFLKRVLLRLFPSGVALSTLLATTFGTGLINIGTRDNLFSHGYSFCVICALVLLLPAWVDSPSRFRSMELGFLVGLIAILRNTNVMIGIYIALFVLNSFSSLNAFKAFLLDHLDGIAVVAATAFVVICPQLLFWKYSMGSWLMNSYTGEHFDFLSPHVVDGLFSMRKGLFFWAPVLLFSPFGFFRMKKVFPAYFYSMAVFSLVNAYIITSWWCWWYGSCFGNRAFVDSYIFFAIPLGCFYSSLRSRIVKITIGLLSVLCICFTMAMTVGYWIGMVPADNTSPSHFIRFFASLGISPTPSYSLGTPLSFTPGHCEPYLMKGFYAPRKDGVWTKVQKATLRMKLDNMPSRDLELSISGNMLPMAPGEGNTLTVGVNGVAIGKLGVTSPDTGIEWKLSLPQAAVRSKNGILHIDFSVDRITPASGIFPEAKSALLPMGVHLDQLRIK